MTKAIAILALFFAAETYKWHPAPGGPRPMQYFYVRGSDHKNVAACINRNGTWISSYENDAPSKVKPTHGSLMDCQTAVEVEFKK